ncbi:MAG: tubulin/FtsZ family protein [Conexivisphaerales archaeon]
MRVGAIGVGQAGGRILDLFVYQNYYAGHKDVLPLTLAINAAKADLMGLTSVPKQDRLLIGNTVVKGHGVGANPEMGAKVAEEDERHIRRAIAERATHQVDAFLIFLGLGGGTGSGASPIIARMIKEVYREPVYAVGILPSESEGSLYSGNAARSLRALTEVADGILLFDNNIWQREGTALKQSFEQMNNEVVKPLHTIFAAGEASNSGRVGTKVIDASDIINSIEGFAAFGYSGWTKSWSEVLKDTGKRALMREKTSVDQLDPANRVFSLIQGAAAGRLSVDCDIKSATKTLVVVAGNPNEMNKEGIDRGKAWLEEITGGAEVRGGDYPLPHSRELVSSVLFSGLKEIPVLKSLIERSQIKKTKKAKMTKSQLYRALPSIKIKVD